MYFKVYVILAHKNPEQLKSLIELLLDQKTLVFIHIDRKSSLKDFKNLIVQPNCFFVKKRVKCKWGTFSLVKATINSFIEARDYMNTYFASSNYHVILLSGEDMPLKSSTYIHDYLCERQDLSLINYWKLPYSGWWDGGLFRFNNIFIFNSITKPYLHKILNQIISKIGFNFLKPYNRLNAHYPEMEVYGSSQWMILNPIAIKHLLNTITIHPKLTSIFRYTFAPDEMFFISLLKLSKPKAVKIENTKNHLVIFNGTNANANYLTIEDLENEINTDTLFGRKFDNQVNKNVIDYVKVKILS
ncbi:beta-1,6-N-acetylglucosaminyltransferase [Mariniflexile sp.]|uniref:beta-1,6-N-acetylglucosaminyltransferase n=1 Tax=Mariniflexile sp. TaxID=1979402 RepID=UPI0035677E54